MSKKQKIKNIQEEVLKEVLFLLKEKFISEQSAAAEKVKEIIPDAGTLVGVEPSGDKNPLLIFWNPPKAKKKKNSKSEG